MKPEELRQKLHAYVNNASAEDLEKLLLLLEEGEVEYGIEMESSHWAKDEEFMKELDRRMEEIDTGKVQAPAAEAVYENALKRLGRTK